MTSCSFLFIHNNYTSVRYYSTQLPNFTVQKQKLLPPTVLSFGLLRDSVLAFSIIFGILYYTLTDQGIRIVALDSNQDLLLPTLGL